MNISDSVKLLLTQIPRLNRSTLRGFLLLRKNKSYIGTLLPNNPIIVEAGAHTGTDTVDMANRWPNAQIHAFEPVPSLFKILTKNTSHFPNVIRHQLALSDKTGSSTMHISEGSSDASSSLLEPKDHLKIHPTVTFDKEITVKTVTLDKWANDNQIKRIDFMWLDMQGMELRMLKKSRIVFPSVGLLYTEINLTENYSGTSLYPEYKKWLHSHEMELLVENTYWNDMGNALFIRRK